MKSIRIAFTFVLAIGVGTVVAMGPGEAVRSIAAELRHPIVESRAGCTRHAAKAVAKKAPAAGQALAAATKPGDKKALAIAAAPSKPAAAIQEPTKPLLPATTIDTLAIAVPDDLGYDYEYGYGRGQDQMGYGYWHRHYGQYGSWGPAAEVTVPLAGAEESRGDATPDDNGFATDYEMPADMPEQFETAHTDVDSMDDSIDDSMDDSMDVEASETGADDSEAGDYSMDASEAADAATDEPTSETDEAFYWKPTLPLDRYATEMDGDYGQEGTDDEAAAMPEPRGESLTDEAQEPLDDAMQSDEETAYNADSMEVGDAYPTPAANESADESMVDEYSHEYDAYPYDKSASFDPAEMEATVSAAEASGDNQAAADEELWEGEPGEREVRAAAEAAEAAAQSAMSAPDGYSRLDVMAKYGYIEGETIDDASTTAESISDSGMDGYDTEGNYDAGMDGYDTEGNYDAEMDGYNAATPRNDDAAMDDEYAAMEDGYGASPRTPVDDEGYSSDPRGRHDMYTEEEGVSEEAMEYDSSSDVDEATSYDAEAPSGMMGPCEHEDGDTPGTQSRAGDWQPCGLELFASRPDALLLSSDVAFLRTLDGLQDELADARRDAFNDYLEGLGAEAIDFATRFEAVTGVVTLDLAEDLPDAAALLAAFRLKEDGELGTDEAIDVLRRSLDNQSVAWTSGIADLVLDPAWPDRGGIAAIGWTRAETGRTTAATTILDLAVALVDRTLDGLHAALGRVQRIDVRAWASRLQASTGAEESESEAYYRQPSGIWLTR